MNPITRKPRTYDPLPRAVSLPFVFLSLLYPRGSFFFLCCLIPRAGRQGRWVHTASFSGFLVFFFSPPPFAAPFLHRFRPSRFACILTRLHARRFAVRPDYPPLSSPSCPSLQYHPTQFLRTLVPFSPPSGRVRTPPFHGYRRSFSFPSPRFIPLSLNRVGRERALKPSLVFQRLLAGLTPRRRGNKFHDPPITPGPSFVRSFLDLNVRVPASFAAPPRVTAPSFSLLVPSASDAC